MKTCSSERILESMLYDCSFPLTVSWSLQRGRSKDGGSNGLGGALTSAMDVEVWDLAAPPYVGIEVSVSLTNKPLKIYAARGCNDISLVSAETLILMLHEPEIPQCHGLERSVVCHTRFKPKITARIVFTPAEDLGSTLGFVHPATLLCNLNDGIQPKKRIISEFTYHDADADGGLITGY